MIISVHLPKTAGTSFALALENNYGARLLRDYADYPINTPVGERNKAALQASINNSDKDFGEIECIHGHFLPIKYLLFSDRQETSFVTWMRNPVERILSHYYYWIRSFDSKTAQPLHKKVVEEKWPLERFCLGPELRDLYCQFLYGFPLEYFSFVGITEFFDDDLEFFSRHYFDAYVEPQKINVGNNGSGYQIEETLRNKIEQFHSRDMSLYNRALEYRFNLR